MPSPSRVQSVDRTLDVLEALADAGGAARSKDLADAVSLPVPTVHRILATLTARGFALQLPDRSYALGPRLVRLGESASQQTGTVVQPLLDELAADLGETVNLAVFSQDSMTYIAQAISRRSMRMFTEVGRRVPCHSTGVGRAVLASMPHSEAAGLVALTLGRSQEADAEAVLAEVEASRKRGFALDDEEVEAGVRCLAVSVDGGPAPAALSVSGPTSRLTPETYDSAANRLRRAAAAIGERWRTVTA